jgi:hypothetical protein
VIGDETNDDTVPAEDIRKRVLMSSPASMASMAIYVHQLSEEGQYCLQFCPRGAGRRDERGSGSRVSIMVHLSPEELRELRRMIDEVLP